MKMFHKLTIGIAFALLTFITAGCQQITPAPVLTAPAVTSTAFAQINLSAPVTATTFTDQPASGSFCYFVQMLDGAGVSAASNTACATTTSALKHIVLNWNAPAGYTCVNNPCSYVLSRAPAILTPVGVPALASPTQTAELTVPMAKPEIQLQLAMR